MKITFEYGQSFLSNIIQHYIETVLKKKDWQIIAIDVARDTVILRRVKEESK